MARDHKWYQTPKPVVKLIKLVGFEVFTAVFWAMRPHRPGDSKHR